MNDLDKIQVALKHVEKRLEGLSRSLDPLDGRPCQKCCTRDGDKIVGRPGEPVRLVGGYETILCTSCKNAWAVAIDEVGHWLEYRTAVTRVKVARDCVKAGIRSGHQPVSENALLDAVTDHVEALVATERKMFQFAMKWMAGGTP